MVRARRAGELPPEVQVYGSPLLHGDQAIVAGFEVVVPAWPPWQRARRAFEAWHVAGLALSSNPRAASNA